ncbi:hypothetical protein BX666DRAFT_1864121 [Dichotomocladium elegans]|nr:hypothetical protein BX666DRAFT_1864121 [Dichotomocladium elegans]
MPNNTPKVHVIGAGVIGLTTAVVLLAKGYDVTLLAKHFPGDRSGDYTSPWAGARWKTVAPNNDLRLQRYDTETFKVFWKLAKYCPAEAGMMVVPSFDYYTNPTAEQRDPWWKNVVPGFHIMPKKDLPPHVQVGYSYTTVTIQPERYLRWLLMQFVALGGKHQRMAVADIADAMGDEQNPVDIVVNCTGMHAASLGGVKDKHMRAVRGQNVVVRASHVRKTMSMSSDAYTYVIPRSDGTVVLGTTKESHGTCPDPDPVLAKDIMDRACKCCPDLTNGKGIDRLDVVAHIVGFRPAREGGPRVETQVRGRSLFGSSTKKYAPLAHNYGHDGSGFQSSWGSAKHLVGLIQEGYKSLQIRNSRIQGFISRL